ncbi:hypothetical protein EBZ39_15315 [bacterium]|nr:hypothetical protein [bacterium]
MPVTIVGNNTPTAGGVVYGDGTNYASTAAGSSGQVLTSAGSSAPTWATPSAGAMTLISTQTASASSSISWTGLSGYSRYIVIVENFTPSTSSDSLELTIGTGATPTYISSGYYSSIVSNASNSAPPQGSASANSAIIDLNDGNVTDYRTQLGGWSGTISFFNMLASPSADTRLTFQAVAALGSVFFRQFSGGGAIYNNTTVKTAIRLKFTTQTIATGKASLYGISS